MMEVFLMILIVSVPNALSVIQQAREAAIKATSYLESQRDPIDGVWPLGERAAASLGLLAKSPYRHKDLSSSVEGRQRLQIETLGISTEFLHKIRAIQLNHENVTNPLVYIDDTALLELMASLRGLCVGQRNYYGYNLVEECVRRFRSGTYFYGGMALALCNARRGVSKEQIRNLATIGKCPGCPFYVEEGSMNLLAAICIADNHRDGSVKDKLARDEVIPALVEKIVKRQDPDDGGFGGFMPTALAVQSLSRADSRLVKEQVIFHGLHKLLQYQKEDGSFGESIGFTSLALPALTGQTLADLRTVKCDKKKSGSHVLSYIVSDLVYSKQRVWGHIDVSNGTRLLSALSRHSRQNPFTFRLRLVKLKSEQVLIKSINGLGTGDRRRWRVIKIFPNGKTENITDTWSDVRVTEDSTYELSLSHSGQ